MKRVIEQIYKFHQVSITSEEETIPDYLFSDRQAQELEKYKVCSTERGNIELHKTVIKELESILSDRANLAALLLPKTKQSLRFSHNDLSSPNILVDNSRIHFIDYDYLGTNYLAYDIANFLSETTFDYFSEDYPGFKHFRRLTFEEVTLYSKFYEGYYADMELDVFKFLSVLNLYWAFWGIKLFENYKGEGFGIP